jgi:hypothetical protein
MLEAHKYNAALLQQTTSTEISGIASQPAKATGRARTDPLLWSRCRAESQYLERQQT